MKYSMIGWSPRRYGYNPTADFSMYVQGKGMYKAEQYKWDTGALLWKSQVFQSKVAHALFKANTSTLGATHYL